MTIFFARFVSINNSILEHFLFTYLNPRLTPRTALHVCTAYLDQ